MGEFDFSYTLPDNFETRVSQYFCQKNRPDLSEAFIRCQYEYEERGFAYYAGIKGDNWNKRAVDFTIEGSSDDIGLLEKSIALCKDVIGKSLSSSKSGLLIKDLFFLAHDVETSDYFTESISLDNCERIGDGGYGDVYKYHNEHLDMDFALKVYNPIYAVETDQFDGERRFFREAKMLFSLHNDGIVRVYDAGRINGKPFIKMEYVEGGTLSTLHEKKGNLSFEDSLSIIRKILMAIGYAHENEVLHRDLKPENILIEKDSERIVIIDFGISAFFDIGRHTQLTKAGIAVAGNTFTDPYLLEHPELRDQRSDIYSIGAIWFYLLSGRSPVGSNIEAVLRFSQKEITDEQVRIIMKCLCSNPEDRYDSCDSLLKELEPESSHVDPRALTISGINTDSITDDEKIVIFYILEKKKRKIIKSEIKTWLSEKEIYGIDIDNAFDLIATLSDGSVTSSDQQSLELGIGLFRDCVLNADRYKDMLSECVDTHTTLASDTFMEICSSFSSIEWLFVSYIVDRHMYSYGDRWMSTEQIEDIKQWELANEIDSGLSDNYGSCLEVFKQHNFVYENAWTSHGNPKEYSLCNSLRTLLSDKTEFIQTHTRTAKDEHHADIPF